MKRTILLLSLLFAAAHVCANDDWIKEVKLWKSHSMSRFTNSLSPDGSIEIDQVYYRETTASRIGLISTQSNSTIYVIDAAPNPKYTFFIWSPNSNYLALHDSSNTHSVLRIFHISKNGIKELTVPNLKHYALESFRLTESEIRSSGQIPIEWNTDNKLKVKVKLKAKDIKLLVVTLRLVGGNVAIIRD